MRAKVPTSNPLRLARRRGLVAALAALSIVAAACSGDDGSATTGDDEATTTSDAPPNTADEGTSSDSTESEAPVELTASARGVTEDTIKIGFAYIDLEALVEAGIIDLNHGPYDEHIQALVEALNEAGGINGRRVEVVPVGYDPVGNEAQQAACIQLTEDEEVFAVLGTIVGDNVLCMTEQHDTVAVVDRDMTSERQERSRAPYATAGPAWERVLNQLVEMATESGLLDDATVAVHSTQPENHSLVTEVIVPALEEAGVTVTFESLIDVGDDVGAASDAIALNTEVMRSEGVDTVFVVGDALVVSTTFAAEGFFPTMFLADMGTAQALAINNDLSDFDGLYTFADFVDPERYEEPTFQEQCVPAWDERHPDDPVKDPRDVAEGEPGHTVGLGVACRTLTIFAAAAEAAGPELTNESFLAGLESVGEIDIPGYGPSSLGPGKHDAQDDLVLYVYDPDDPEGFRGFARYDG